MAVLTGILFLIIIVAGIFIYAFLIPDNYDNAEYDNGINQFLENESIALELYDIIKTNDSEKALIFINETGIPVWNKNLEILDRLDNIEGLSDELLEQNKILREYCNLRLELYNLYVKTIAEKTDKYQDQIIELNNQLDKLF